MGGLALLRVSSRFPGLAWTARDIVRSYASGILSEDGPMALLIQAMKQVNLSVADNLSHIYI